MRCKVNGVDLLDLDDLELFVRLVPFGNLRQLAWPSVREFLLLCDHVQIRHFLAIPSSVKYLLDLSLVLVRSFLLVQLEALMVTPQFLHD